MTLGRISAVVFSMIFGVVTLAAGTLLVLGGQWAGLILLLPGAALVAVAMRINDRPEAGEIESSDGSVLQEDQ